MDFSRIETSLKRPGMDDQSELLRNVHLLVDCFVQSGGGLQGGGDATDTSIAGDALVAATLAERRINELSKRVNELEKLAMTDELTGLMNRRGFDAELNRALSSAARYGERGVLIYIDLDDFKPINDHYGHSAGDEVLRHVGRLLADNIRDTDYISRLGGDEFAVLMPRTLWKNGLARAGLIENRLNKARIIWQGQPIAIQASLGLQSYASGDNPSDLLKRADEAMYKTKRCRASLLGGEIGQKKKRNTPAERPLRRFLYAAS